MIVSPRFFPLLGLLPSLVLAQSGVDVTVEDAWVRALPATQNRTAAYLTVANSGDRPVEITGAIAELAGRVEIHTTREVDGLMRMEQLSGLTVAPGQSESLAPGGTHLMLLKLERMPVPGDSIELCLQLATGAAVCTQAPVRKSASAGEHNHNHH